MTLHNFKVCLLLARLSHLGPLHAQQQRKCSISHNLQNLHSIANNYCINPHDTQITNSFPHFSLDFEQCPGSVCIGRDILSYIFHTEPPPQIGNRQLKLGYLPVLLGCSPILTTTILHSPIQYHGLSLPVVVSAMYLHETNNLYRSYANCLASSGP